MSEEKEVWFGTPSQVLNLGTFILMGIFFWLVIPLFVILWKWLAVKNTKYELTTERLKTRYGVLNKKTDELELYRVRDYKFEQPFFLRLFSLGNIVLQTSDKSHPEVEETIKYYEELAEELKNESKPPPKDLTNIHEISIVIFFSFLILAIVLAISKLNQMKKKK